MKADGHATKAMANLKLYLSPQIATCEIKLRVVKASISISNAEGLVVADTTLTFCLSLSTAARTSSLSGFEADKGIQPRFNPQY